MRPAQLLAVSALALSANTYAASFDSLDLYYSSADLDLQGRTDSSSAGTVNYGGSFESLDGFGAKFRGSVGDDFFFSGEWQRVKTEHTGITLTDSTGASLDGGSDGDLSYTEWRLGLGLPVYRASSLTIYGLAEYVSTETKLSYGITDPDSGDTAPNELQAQQQGAAAHAGALFSPLAGWSLYGQVGYVHLEDVDGVEYLVGTAVQLHRYGGVFAEYRNSDLENDGDGKVELTPWRAGIYLLVQ